VPGRRAIWDGDEDIPSVRIKAGEKFTVRRSTGRGDTAHLDDADRDVAPPDTPHVLGRRGDPVSRGPCRRLLRVRLGEYGQISSPAICVNPHSGLNCYWEMPFRKSCKITLQDIGEEDVTVYYQIDYTLTDVPADAAYFHAQFRRVNPLPYKGVVTLLDGVKGWGQYVGPLLPGGPQQRLVGEGEIKFYIDGTWSIRRSAGQGPRTISAGRTI